MTASAGTGEVEVGVTESSDGTGRRIDVVVRNRGREAVEAPDVRIPLPDVRPAQVLEHGWQSWSPVRRCAPDAVVAERAELPDWVLGCYLADPTAAGRVATDQFLVHDGGVAGWLDGRRHVGVFDVAADGVTAVALLDRARLAPGEERVLDPLWVSAGPPGSRYSEYAARWGHVAGARAAARSRPGWCSWYQYFSKVTPGHVVANAALAGGLGLEVIQIDDGYQAAIGDWLDPWPGWDEGVGAVARSIRAPPLHRRLWINDPDCALLRPTATDLTAAQRRALADVIAGTGGFTVVSDDLSTYGDAERDELARLRRTAAAADGPLDLDDPFSDTVRVRSPATTLDVRWPEIDVTLTETDAISP